jgi:hypothetical protein
MFKSILLPIDLNEPGSWARALPAALEAAKVTGGKLHVVTVAPDVNTQVAPYFPTDVNLQSSNSFARAASTAKFSTPPRKRALIWWSWLRTSPASVTTCSAPMRRMSCGIFRIRC